MLAGVGKTDQRLDATWIAGERSQIPSLSFGRALRGGPAFESLRRVGETLGDPGFLTRVNKSAAARRLQQQNVELPGNTPGYPGLDRSEVFGSEFMPARLKIL